MVCKDQLAGALRAVAINKTTPTVLFMVNNAEGPDALIDAVGPERVLLGLPGAGGTREGNVVRYHVLSPRQQPTTLGELDGRRTARLEAIASALKEAGFPVSISKDMDAWLETHVMCTCPAAHALYMVGASNYALAQTQDAVLLWIRAVHQGFRALRREGVKVTPSSLRAFAVVPEPLLAAFL
jgi:2-dehydropantoate 2-reductase